MASNRSVHIVLLGKPQLRLGKKFIYELERKVAALLACAAFEGGWGRDRLASWLWPQAKETTARNNLSQTLSRLRQLAGCSILEGGPWLRLTADVTVDVAPLLVGDAPESVEQFAEFSESLLAGFHYDDCPEFDAWLQGRQIFLNQKRIRALMRLCEEAEGKADLRGALHHASRLLVLDPLSETAHRTVIRLYWLMGDRAAAIAAYEHCRNILKNDLDVQPNAQTRELLEAVLRDGKMPLRSRPLRTNRIPPALLRPPLLAGREGVLNRMEEAWEAGKAIFIEGPRGIGKTRLMQDFLAARGRFYTFDGRPEDFAVPYATHSRTYREMLQAFPSLKLPKWVCQELARILPELGGGSKPPVHEYDRLRFFHAMAEATRLAVEAGMRLVGVDNLQFIDLASLEAGHFVYAQHWGRKDGMRTVICLQREALAPEALKALNWVIDREFGICIELSLLDEARLAEMLAGLGLGLEHLAGALFRHCGGNPFFVLEILRAVFESGSLDQAAQGQWPLPQSVHRLIRRRLDGLSVQALQLARLAALSPGCFSPTMAAAIFEQSVSQITALWVELESSQVLAGNNFVHRLMHEIVLGDITDPLRSMLEDRIRRNMT